MTKRKQSKSTTTRKREKVVASKRKLTEGGRRSKVPVTASATVMTLFKKTRRRIKEIEKRALGKLRGKDTGQ
jgi:DNA-directed RNA polymerase sigma subunit (sigma70/sigma32)